ncbi:MAG: glucuronate isomerase [Vicinamibacterales bacterium]
MADITESPAHVVRDPAEVRRLTTRVIDHTPVFDMHTHLFPPAFGDLARWGIDDLLTYHYLAAELMRSADVRPEQYYGLSTSAKADLIWETLFVRNTPLSEATRGVIAVLSAFGLDPSSPDLREARAFYQGVRLQDHVGRVLDIARVEAVVMTNDPFDPAEVRVWDERPALDSRFHTALRLDTLLKDHSITSLEAHRFVDTWIQRIKPLYMAVSLGDDFTWPDEGPAARLIRDVVLPACRDHGLPLAMMIGVRRQVNPALRDAGDGVGRAADMTAVQRLCAEHPDNRFMVTMLSRGNQHELCVAARAFPNLMPFGCWWFLNNPSIVSEITRERLEMLGASFIAQHSDARVLEQLIYKWAHARHEIAAALAGQYLGLLDDGRPVAVAEIERDVKRLFADNFLQWTPSRHPA